MGDEGGCGLFEGIDVMLSYYFHAAIVGQLTGISIESGSLSVPSESGRNLSASGGTCAPLCCCWSPDQQPSKFLY
jgi:hypothetical protein